MTIRTGYWVVCGLVSSFALIACGDSGSEVASPTDPGASPTFEYYKIPPEPGPEWSAARSDEFGAWRTVSYYGVSVEIPVDVSIWRLHLIRDPCYGDGRSFLLVEELATGERIQVFLAEPRVLVTTREPRLEPLVLRIRESYRGAFTPSANRRTFGPLPTEVYCDPDAEGVPTISPDEFTPPAG